MKKEKVLKLATKMLEEHDLHLNGWRAKTDKAKNRFGQCNHTKKTISISEEYAEINSEERVRRTIIHEVAHALAGRGVGHGSLWRELVCLMGGGAGTMFHKQKYKLPEATIHPEMPWVR